MPGIPPKERSRIVIRLRKTKTIPNSQGRSQDFLGGGAEIMEAKAMKRKNCLG